MIARDLAAPLRVAFARYPIVTLTGPRQSGKTTLCRALFPDLPYRSLEPLDTRDWAQRDPRGFLSAHPDGAIVDEIQRVPSLASYLQEVVDADPTPGRWILTGSQHLGISEAVSQSLAGRTAVLHLLPPSLAELRRFTPDPVQDVWTTVWTGAYPRIHDRGVPADRWLADYVATYVERDVRQVVRVGDLSAFSTFLRLCAGRTAQELNLSALGSDAGVSHNTARSWLSVLEAGFLVTRLPAWHRNVRKQAVKAPKLHFLDSGLVCHLLGIRHPADLVTHPLRGAIFESWVVSERLRARTHAGRTPSLWHLRETRGIEIDLLEYGSPRRAIEVKSGATVVSDHATHLRALLADDPTIDPWLVHAGEASGVRWGVNLLPWHALDTLTAG